MDTSSITIEQLRGMEPEQVRVLAREASTASGQCRDTDPGLSAEWHNLSAGLHELARWIEQSS